EILQQGRESAIQILNQQMLLLLRRVVRVPSRAVDEVQIEGDFHEPDAGLHQAPRQQTALAELAAVRFAQDRRLPLQIEYAQEARARQFEPLLADRSLRLHVCVA